jgi:phosphorylcholine metabolism protein LicD
MNAKSFRNENERLAYKNLCIFRSVIEEHLIDPLILDGGSLLGAYRDKNFPEDDWDDIDITTFDSQWEKVDDLTKKLEEKGFDLYHIWRPTENRSGQVAYKKDGCKIDLMFKRFSDENQRAGRAWWCVYMGGKAIYKSVPLEYYAELKDIKLHDLIFDAPKNIEGYLKYRYGDWRKKVNRKDYSCYISDKSIVNDYEKI